jgi:hypothetical protein
MNDPLRMVGHLADDIDPVAAIRETRGERAKTQRRGNHLGVEVVLADEQHMHGARIVAA